MFPRPRQKLADARAVKACEVSPDIRRAVGESPIFGEHFLKVVAGGFCGDTVVPCALRELPEPVATAATTLAGPAGSDGALALHPFRRSIS